MLPYPICQGLTKGSASHSSPVLHIFYSFKRQALLLQRCKRKKWELFFYVVQQFKLIWHCVIVGNLFTYFFLRRHSLGASWHGFTNRVDHVSGRGTPGSAVLCELTRHFHPVLSPHRVAEDRGGSCRQLASNSSAPCAKWCAKVKVFDQLTFGTSCNMTKPADEQCRHTWKAEAATLFHRWHTISAPYT